MTKTLSILNEALWGAPALVLILGVGLYLTIRLGTVQITMLPRALKALAAKLRPGKQTEGTSSFQALCTALAATVGTGNLIGVAGAVCLGGPGAVFWMWISGFLGMATKYAEAVLAVRYRVREGQQWKGGPMYTISRGLGKGFAPLASLYCVFGLLASFGVGNAVQINAVAVCLGGGNLLLGIGLGLLVFTMLSGGARRIGVAAEKIVPFASALYILLCLGVLIVRFEALPGAVAAIFQGAFSPRAVTGGALGSAFLALRVGCSRGVFTNEAGMGTASIAHASAEVSHPAEQGLMGIVEVFLDTIVICTLTALAILTSGVPIPYGTDAGAALTNEAFFEIYGPFGPAVIRASLICFALATILGWGLYGGRCAEYLLGKQAWKAFSAAQGAAAVLGTVLPTAAVWKLCETLNGLMLIPNLIAILALTPELRRLTKDYKTHGGASQYADFHQRQPLRALSHAEIPSPGCQGQGSRKENLPSEHWPAGPSHAGSLL